MKKSVLTLINLLLISFATRAQVSGSADVCPANIYSYTASIAGASSYTWTLPNGWYNISGQGTATITATCNVTAGNVCAEGFTSNGTSLGSVCQQTIFGGGGTGWDVVPAATGVCTGGGGVSLSIVPNGTGGNCPNGCGNGTPVPNLKYCIYDDLWPNGSWVGDVGPISFFSTGGDYYIYQCDVAAGHNPPQAVRIQGGCTPAAINNVASVFPNSPIPPYTYQDPIDPCIGDTVEIVASGLNPCWGCVNMITGLNLISPQFGSSAYFVVTSLTASADVSALDFNGCLGFNIHYLTTGLCNPTLLEETGNEARKMFVSPNPAKNFVVVSSELKDKNLLQIINATGQVVFEDNNFAEKSKVDISKFIQGVYFVKVNDEQVKFVKL